MIYLVTGTPGAGKTLRTVQLVIGWLKEGKTVFTNINGLDAPGDLRSFDGHLDWTDTPEGSVVVYDEAQRYFGADGGRGRSDRADIAGLETHRHTGHTVVFITQHPRLLHSHVTRLVGRHEHVARMFGTQNTFIYWLDRLLNVDSKSDLKLAQTENWRYPTELFPYYKSSSLHINNRRIPKRVWWMLFGALVVFTILGFGLYKVFTSPQLGVLLGNKTAQLEQEHRILGDVASGKTTAVQVRADQAPGSIPGAVATVRPIQQVDYPAQDWAGQREEATPVAGCIANHRDDKPRCACYSTNMTPIVMPTAECLSRIKEPLPRTLGAGGGGQRAGAQGRAPATDRQPQREPVRLSGPLAASELEVADKPWPSVSGYQGGFSHD